MLEPSGQRGGRIGGLRRLVERALRQTEHGEPAVGIAHRERAVVEDRRRRRQQSDALAGEMVAQRGELRRAAEAEGAVRLRSRHAAADHQTAILAMQEDAAVGLRRGGKSDGLGIERGKAGGIAGVEADMVELGGPERRAVCHGTASCGSDAAPIDTAPANSSRAGAKCLPSFALSPGLPRDPAPRHRDPA